MRVESSLERALTVSMKLYHVVWCVGGVWYSILFILKLELWNTLYCTWYMQVLWNIIFYIKMCPVALELLIWTFLYLHETEWHMQKCSKWKQGVVQYCLVQSNSADFSKCGLGHYLSHLFLVPKSFNNFNVTCHGHSIRTDSGFVLFIKTFVSSKGNQPTGIKL